MSILLRAIDSPEMTSLYHVTSPDPIRSADMMASYRRAVGRRIGIPSPSLITKVGAWLIGSDPALALTGRRGVPTRLLAEGFRFQVPSFDDALKGAVLGEARTR